MGLSPSSFIEPSRVMRAIPYVVAYCSFVERVTGHNPLTLSARAFFKFQGVKQDVAAAHNGALAGVRQSRRRRSCSIGS